MCLNVYITTITMFFHKLYFGLSASVKNILVKMGKNPGYRRISSIGFIGGDGR